MAGILKNQLVKRLACFTKGLSVDKIDLDILSGRGYLDNLELDEHFMTSVLELPPWISFTKILCSKIRLKVSFTKLKSEPIRIFIDTVYVEAEISKQAKRNDINIQQKLADAGLAASGPTSYGYIEQVIDGMHITVSTIRLTVSLRHQYFITELSGVELVSTNRKWKPDDLKKTRAYVMPGREEVLVYKMLTVSHAKFEFFDKSSSCQMDHRTPPLKFNFNMIHLLITMKKLVATNEVSSACLKLILDDLLLVFTPSQLQVLLAFSKELSEVIELSAPPTHATPAPTHTASPTKNQQTAKSFLHRFSRQHEEEDNEENVIEVVTDNVLETSYHLKTGTIDILLCDDDSTNNAGSLQFRFEVVQIGLFPHRTGNASRRHWNIPFQYVKDAQTYSAEMLGDFAETCLSRGSPLHNTYEMVVVLRCEHFQILPVMGVKKRQILGPLLFSDKKKFGISDTEPALVITIATYYGDKPDAQVPPQNVYVHLNPTEINFDVETVWWLREFISSTMTEDFKLMLTELSKGESTAKYKLKVNLVLPHVTIPLNHLPEADETGQIKGLQFWFSKLIISNLNNALYLPLLSQLQECLQDALISGHAGFPNKTSDQPNMPHIPNADLLPQIIEELSRHERLRQELQDEKVRQRRGVPGANHSPELPGTPDSAHSRRSSVGSVHVADTLAGSPILNISELFPLLDNLALGFHFQSFSADFLYATDCNSGEKYRSRRFVSDVPLQMWLIEEPAASQPDLLENGHKKLSRNTLRRQETLTCPPTDYLILLKCLKSVHCTLDREQYLFLLRLQQEVQSFVEKIILSVTQIFTSNVQDSACFKMLATIDHVMLDINLPGPARTLSFVSSSSPGTASTSLSHLSSPSSGSRRSVGEPPDEILLLEPDKCDASCLDQRAKLNWIAVSRSDSNIASISERLSLHSEDDAMSISSLTNDLNPLAKGDSKETLLKFIMRVNKKRETNSVGCQTAPVSDIVANNYQEMHARAPSLRDCVLEGGPIFRNQLQIHCGACSLVLHSARDVTTKISCRKVIVLDTEFETKPRHFPEGRWRGKSADPQLLVRLDLRQFPPEFGSVTTLHRTGADEAVKMPQNDVIKMPQNDVIKMPQNDVIKMPQNDVIKMPEHDFAKGEWLPSSETASSDGVLTCGDNFSEEHMLTHDNNFAEVQDGCTSEGDSLPDYKCEMTCEVVAANITASLRDVTLEGLSAFFQPDPTIEAIPMTLTCDVRHCEASLDVAGTTQLLRVPQLRIKLNLDESWEIGSSSSSPRENKEGREEREESEHCELEQLRKENRALREQLAGRKL